MNIDREVIERFRDTLRRFSVIKEKTMAELLEEMSKDMLSNFGTPNQMYASPETYKQLKGLSEQIDDADK